MRDDARELKRRSPTADVDALADINHVADIDLFASLWMAASRWNDDFWRPIDARRTLLARPARALLTDPARNRNEWHVWHRLILSEFVFTDSTVAIDRDVVSLA